MSEPDPKPPQSSGLSGLLGQVFAYIDKPWKAVVVVALIIIGGGMWILYDKREEFLEAWLTPNRVYLKINEVPDALEKAVQESGADLVQIWQVDLEQNSQRFVAARRKDGQRAAIPEPRRLPIITNAVDVKGLADVISGNPYCIDLTAKGSAINRRLFDRGFLRGCAIPIPPSPVAFVGVIYIAWETRQEASVEDVAIGAMRDIAVKLVSR